MKIEKAVRISLLQAQRDFAVELVGCRDMHGGLRLMLQGVLGMLGAHAGGTYAPDSELGMLTAACFAGDGRDLQAVFDRLLARQSAADGSSSGFVRYLAQAQFAGCDRAALDSAGVAGILLARAMEAPPSPGWLVVALQSGAIPDASAMRAISRFVSSSRRLLEAVRTRQIRLDAALELHLAARGAGVATWEIDLTEKRLVLSDRAGEIHGIGNALPRTPKDALAAVLPADRKELLVAIRRAIRSGTVISHEFRTVAGARWIAIDFRFYPTPVAILLGVSRDVTTHKLRKSQLAGLETRLRAMVTQRTRELDLANAQMDSELSAIRMAMEGSGAGFWHLDVLTGAVLLDAVAESIYGLSNDGNLTLDRIIERIHPDSRDILFSRLSETLAPQAESDWDHEFQINHPTCGLRWLSGRGHVFRDQQGRAIEMAGINIDVTELKEAEAILRGWNAELERQVESRTRELSESEMRFKILADAIADGVVVSQGGIILDLNTQIATMFGYAPEEVVGRPVVDFVAPESVNDVVASLRSNRDDLFEWTGQRRDGTRIPVESRAKMRVLDGKMVRIGVVRDLSESKRIEAEISTLRAELEQSRKLALMGEVSAGIVHQISQPLSAVGGNLAALRSRIAPCANSCCKVMEFLDEATASVARMRDIISHIRKVAGPRAPALFPTSINSVVLEMLPLLQSEADSRNLRIQDSLGDDLPVVLADASHLSQLLAYLVRGAMEETAATDGLGWIKVTTRPGDVGGVALSVTHVRAAPPGSGEEVPSTAPESTQRWMLELILRYCRMVALSHHGRFEEVSSDDGGTAGYQVVLPPASHPNTKV